jgi:Chaperone for flagella basal body P-ring formation
MKLALAMMLLLASYAAAQSQTKSCAEFSEFAARASLREFGSSRGWVMPMQCSGTPRISESTQLELVKSGWNAALQRWQFALRCADSRTCVPFLLWTRSTKPRLPAAMENASAASTRIKRERLIAAGQTATLTWDQAGIRVTVPVTCMDGGSFGDRVRVRLKNSALILDAEVVGVKSVRAQL